MAGRSKKITPPTLDEVRAEIVQAVDDWRKRHGDFRNLVFLTLDAKAASIIAGAIGFEKRFGDWEVDHCNGREPLVAQLLSAAAKEHVREWLDANSLPLPARTAKIVKELRDEYHDLFARHLRQTIGDRARAAAYAQAEEMISAALAKSA